MKVDNFMNLSNASGANFSWTFCKENNKTLYFQEEIEQIYVVNKNLLSLNYHDFCDKKIYTQLRKKFYAEHFCVNNFF